MLGSAKIGSLSSSLLARKGQARPAMRSQGYAGFSGVGQGLDDLGWNDMGSGEAAPLPVASVDVAPVVRIEPVESEVPVEAPVPQVLVEREALEEFITAPVAVKSVSVATATRFRRETARTGKAAFTLRLDAERHLRLRLASAVTDRSSQQLVTEALDALLKSVTEVETLVAQLSAATRKR
ncbi:hypothetical protein ACT009_05100 [Sphingomonas sp. Tas61C01]|uniref:hypothetical protein n=1 Tax=Sphingomonas sp. Tas61C01 TaxID=3458297 RepID=UPI00403EDC06